MEKNPFFDFNRLKYLIIRQFTLNYKTMMIAVGAIAGFLLVVGTLTIVFAHKNYNDEQILGLIMPTLFLTGIIYTSMVFAELNNPNRGYVYLTLPASAFEKLVTAWLFSSVFYIVFSAVFLLFINLCYLAIANLFSSSQVALVNIFDPDVLYMFGTYLVVQSVFFLGAIYFRRINFLKTILSWFLFFMVIAIYSGILAKILFGTASFDSAQFSHSIELEITFENYVVPVLKFIRWFLVAPFFLVVSYFRLKERQV
ncbi:MAG: hypothetical protein U0W24_22630 [Bacteroidales bacterium]